MDTVYAQLTGFPQGVSGFISKGGNIYYMSAYPITDTSGGNAAGTLILGRVIDDEEIEVMTEGAGVNFTVTGIDRVPFSTSELESLNTSKRALVIDGGVATAYSSFDDIFGDTALMVSVQDSSRALYMRGVLLITVIIILAALGCGLALILVLNLLGKIILRPLTGLVTELEGINHERVDGRVTVNESSLEMSNLTNAINSMLNHIEDEQEQIRKKNESLYKSAHFDALTGLSNRTSATEDLEETVKIAQTGGYNVTVYYMDIDRFKFINDILGHRLGNELMQMIAERLQNTFGGESIYARMHGDEFLVCVEHLEDKADRQECASRIMDLFAAPFQLRDRKIEVSASVGSALYPGDGLDADTLIKNAEIAMYQAKESGTGLYIAYKKDLHDALQRKVRIENQLRTSIHNGCREFLAYFQPKLSVETGRIEQCEALIRWNLPEGMIFPDEFIPQAEESGLIVPMTWWMIDECGRQGRRFSDRGMPMSIAINIPAQVLLHEEFTERIAAAQAAMGGSNLEIEIVERTLLDDIDMVGAVFKTLHEGGVEISVDDFGTGYSSLSYLNKLSIDRIKIDRSFMRGLEASEDDRSIVRAIVAMAKSLGIIVTAEGVEDQFQYNFLRGMDCDEIQGYYISRPVEADQYINFINEWNEHNPQD